MKATEPFKVSRPGKVTIASLDDERLEVSAQYNPKEIDLAKATSWKDHNGIPSRDRTESWVDLEYTGTPARTMTLELLFDGFEDDTSIEPVIAALNRLSSPRDEHSTKDMLRRPHVCVAVWNDKEMPPFRCVIESLGVKYTMFGKQGRPLRAVCNVKLMETRLHSASLR